MKYPISHYYSLESVPDNMHDSLINEFKDNGVTNFVLPCTVLERIVREPSRYGFITRLAKKHGITFGDAHMPFGQHLDICCRERGRRGEAGTEKECVLVHGEHYTKNPVSRARKPGEWHNPRDIDLCSAKS